MTCKKAEYVYSHMNIKYKINLDRFSSECFQFIQRYRRQQKFFQKEKKKTKKYQLTIIKNN